MNFRIHLSRIISKILPAIRNVSTLIKILTLILVVILLLIPWPSTKSFGEFSGFDSANVYIKHDPSFNTDVNSSSIISKSVAPGTENIQLALSDLPYRTAFKITVRNQSLNSYPVRISISYPLNPSHVDLLFSSFTNQVYLQVYNSTGGIERNEKFIQYSLYTPVEVVVDIGTAQSSDEYISISVNNQTTTSITRLKSEVASLLRDQARLVSVDVENAVNFLPGFLVLNGSKIWNIRNEGQGQGNSTLIESDGTFSIVSGSYSQTYLEHIFSAPANWSSYDTLTINMKGSGTSQFLRFWLNTDWNNRAFFYIKDDFAIQRSIIVPMRQPERKTGEPTLNSIERMGIDFPSFTGTWSVGDIRIGKRLIVEGETEVSISDFYVTIKLHSLAYAPLTSAPIFAIAAISIMLGWILAAYFSGLKIELRKIQHGFSKLQMTFLKTFLIVGLFLGVFALYSLFFSVGDHAFDMFSQKLWSYDMAKYGLLSVYQRPAVTSAASMFDGQGTQHAIFAYSPLAGLYYFLIGHLYFLLSPHPSVTDPLFSVIVKSIHTITTIGCGILVFKLMRIYGFSWRGSYLTVAAFLLNPLILYDAAIWGHQDSLLIFFLLLSLVAYESSSPKIAWFAIALAVMVKSTAFAPAILMAFLLLRKFGVSRSFNGIVVGLGAGLTVILPYVLLGASPLMLVNSTVFRVFQYGTTAYQYPRSAAVSPDGYNVWPLVTYFAGARSRDRMWYPDYAATPYLGISYLLLGEIVFVSVLIVLFYLATRTGARFQGVAPLLLGVMMIASVLFLTKTTSRYYIFGVAYLLVSNKIISNKIKWLTIGIITFTSVFAMHGLLISYTGEWLRMYPSLSPDIPINSVILYLYLSDIVISEMILRNIFAFILIFVATVLAVKKLGRKNANTQQA